MSITSIKYHRAHIAPFPLYPETIAGFRLVRERMIGRGGRASMFVVGPRNGALVVKEPLKTSTYDLAAKRETDILSKFTHPNIVKSYAFWQSNERCFIAMKRYAMDLATVLRQTRVSREQAFYFVREIAKGLAYVHLRGYAHADVKPQNVLLDRPLKHCAYPGVVLIDFDVARPEDEFIGTERMGVVYGTRCYLSPRRRTLVPMERDDGLGTVTVRSDVFAAPIAKDDLYALACTFCIMRGGLRYIPPDIHKKWADDARHVWEIILSDSSIAANERAFMSELVDEESALQNGADVLVYLDHHFPWIHKPEN